MLSLDEVEAAADRLPQEQQLQLFNHLAARLSITAPTAAVASTNVVPQIAVSGQRGHSVLEIPSHSVGPILRPFSPDDDRMEDLLEDRDYGI